MVYTLTANPCLDYILKMPRIVLDATNRSKGEKIIAGGKGLNVARVLKSFGVEAKTYGVVAGFTGREWLRQVLEMNINTQVIQLKDGITRINIKLTGVEQTEINATGPDVSEDEKIAFYKMFDEVSRDDIMVISGNTIPKASDETYAKILRKLLPKGVKVILDCAGEQMRNALPLGPYLIKPNLDELKEIANTCLETQEDMVDCCERLIRMGAHNVFLSLGSDGAIFVGEDGAKYRIKAPMGRVKNTVGSGDAMVAAFVYGMLADMDMKESIRLAVAAGSAGAFSDELATKSSAYELLDSIECVAI